MERRLHALEVQLLDGLQRFDDVVQIDRHLGELLPGKADARVFRDSADLALGKVLGHWFLSFRFQRTC